MLEFSSLTKIPIKKVFAYVDGGKLNFMEPINIQEKVQFDNGRHVPLFLSLTLILRSSF